MADFFSGTEILIGTEKSIDEWGRFFASRSVRNNYQLKEMKRALDLTSFYTIFNNLEYARDWIFNGELSIECRDYEFSKEKANEFIEAINLSKLCQNVDEKVLFLSRKEVGFNGDLISILFERAEPIPYLIKSQKCTSNNPGILTKYRYEGFVRFNSPVLNVRGKERNPFAFLERCSMVDEFTTVEIKELGRREDTIIKARLDQNKFSKGVLGLHGKECVISGDKHAVEAAHIDSGKDEFGNFLNNSPKNGIPLRSDIHRVFDEGAIRILADLSVCVSCKEKYKGLANYNGRKIKITNVITKKYLKKI